MNRVFFGGRSSARSVLYSWREHSMPFLKCRISKMQNFPTPENATRRPTSNPKTQKRVKRKMQFLTPNPQIPIPLANLSQSPPKQPTQTTAHVTQPPPLHFSHPSHPLHSPRQRHAPPQLAMKSTPRNLPIRARRPRRNRLPDNLPVIAQPELRRAITDHRAVGRAARAAAAGRGGHRSGGRGGRCSGG